MFFGSIKKKTAESDRVIQQMNIQKEEIKKRLKQMTEVNKQLDEAVKETHIISVELIEKLHKELKIAKKSITSICSKLKDGVILVNHLGKIIQLNKATEKLFEIKSKEVEGKDFYEIIALDNSTKTDNILKTKINSSFFLSLSDKLLSKLQIDNNSSHKEYLQNEHFDFDTDKVVDILIPTSTKPIKVIFSFSILDNDPVILDDIIFIFIFSHTHLK